MSDSVYQDEELAVPDADRDAGVVRRWKVTSRRTGNVSVVAQLKPLPNTPNPWRLLCTCGDAICPHRNHITDVLAPRAPLGIA